MPPQMQLWISFSAWTLKMMPLCWECSLKSKLGWSLVYFLTSLSILSCVFTSTFNFWGDYLNVFGILFWLGFFPFLFPGSPSGLLRSPQCCSAAVPRTDIGIQEQWDLRWSIFSLCACEFLLPFKERRLKSLLSSYFFPLLLHWRPADTGFSKWCKKRGVDQECPSYPS